MAHAASRSRLPKCRSLGRWLRHLAVLPVLAAAAFSAVPSPAQAQDKPLKKVRIAVGTPVLNVSYPWLTMPIALGYWKEEGYDVEVVTVAGSLQGLQQLAAGGVEFSMLNSTGLIQADTDNNLAVRGIMGIGVIDWGIAVTDESPIKSIADFKGKKIGIVSLATGGVPLLKGLLAANGMTMGTDVQLIATGGGAPALDALKSDRVQGLMFWDAALVGFNNAGVKTRVFRDPKWRAMPDFTLGTMQKTIDTDPAMVEAISRGAAKAIAFSFANPECVRKIHWATFPSTKPTGADNATLEKWDLALLNSQLSTMHDGYKMNGDKLFGALNEKSYADFEDFMFDQGLIKRKVPAATMLIDKPGFVEAINKFDRSAIEASAKACKY
jgi:NitT/TauT family transport system substrate-binding protein